MFAMPVILTVCLYRKLFPRSSIEVNAGMFTAIHAAAIPWPDSHNFTDVLSVHSDQLTRKRSGAKAPLPETGTK
jgi:hypothetical protein